MKLIEVESTSINRKAYIIDDDEKHLISFTKGIEVLPAMYYENGCSNRFIYIQTHEPGTLGWKDGGHECYDDTGARRAFFLDALIVHPRYFKKKAKIEKHKVTGGKRGRPSMDPSLKKVLGPYVPTGGKRGRPSKDPSEIKSTVYVPTGGKRGRPKKDN
jgi:hypothetical protein